MKRFLHALLALFVLSASFLVLQREILIVEASPEIHQGDLILQGNNVTIIEGRFDINGSIIVEENATLILRNAIVNFTQTEQYQFLLLLQNPVNGAPSLHSENTTITSSGNLWFYVTLSDNCTGSISNTTIIAYLNIQDSVNAYVSDSEVGFLVASKSSFLSVHNCTITTTFSFSHSPTVLISNSTIIYANLQLNSVNCSVTNFGPGLFPYWNFYINCSATVSLEGYAPNVTIINSVIEGWQLSVREESNVMITNSTINTLFSYYNTTVWLVNSTALRIQYHMEGKVYVSWYLQVHVIDSIEQNIPNANITAKYQNTTIAESTQTDVNGLTRLTLMEKMMNATGEYPVGNYTVEATYDIYSAIASINMTENKQITLKLEDFVIPEFPSILALTLLIITLLIVTVYKRKFKAHLITI